MGKLKKFVAKAILCLSTLSSFVPNSRVDARLDGHHIMTVEEENEMKKKFEDDFRAYIKNHHTQFVGMGLGGTLTQSAIVPLILPSAPAWFARVVLEFQKNSFSYETCKSFNVKHYHDAINDATGYFPLDCKSITFGELEYLEKLDVPCALVAFITKANSLHAVLLYRALNQTDTAEWKIYDGLMSMFETAEKEKIMIAGQSKPLITLLGKNVSCATWKTYLSETQLDSAQPYCDSFFGSIKNIAYVWDDRKEKNGQNWKDLNAVIDSEYTSSLNEDMLEKLNMLTIYSP